MNKFIVPAVIVILLIAAGGALLLFKNSANTTPKQPEKSFSLAEISTHNNAQDCWMAIEGKVYDVTKFIPSHEGGDQILLGCGKDATELFNNRPGDKGPHPESARQKLVQFEIGTLEN